MAKNSSDVSSKRHIDQSMEWRGFSDVLSGNKLDPLLVRRQRYAVGAGLARRHLSEFHEKERDGRSYGDVQAEHLQRESEIVAAVARANRRTIAGLEKNIEKIHAAWDAQPENKSDASVKEEKRLTSMIEQVKQEQRDAELSPCSSCPAYALCGQMNMACAGFVAYINGDPESKLKRAIPSVRDAERLKHDDEEIGKRRRRKRRGKD